MEIMETRSGSRYGNNGNEKWFSFLEIMETRSGSRCGNNGNEKWFSLLLSVVNTSISEKYGLQVHNFCNFCCTDMLQVAKMFKMALCILS